MPTKTNKPSPFQIPAALVGTAVKTGLGAFSGGLKNFSQAIKDVDKEEFKNMKFGEKLKTGLNIYAQGMKGTLGGAAQGLLGDDFGLVNDGEQELNEPQPTYSTNMMKIPMTMKPLKMLTPYNMSYVAKNMKASEAETAMKMQDISGSSTLTPNKMLGDLDKNGVMSDYEQARQDAIEKNMKK